MAQYRFVSIPGKGYLENATVNAFAKDSYGFIWIATDNGPVVFDGVNTDQVVLLDENNAPIKVLSMMPLNDDKMLVGTPKGLFAISIGGADSGHSIERMYPDKIGAVKTMGILGTDAVGIATANTFYVLGSAGDIKHEMSLNGLCIKDIKQTKGYRVLATDKGLYVYNSGSIKPAEIEGMPHLPMGAMMLQPGRFFVSAREKKGNAIYVYTAAQKKVQRVDIGDVIVTAMVQVPDGTILVGTNGDGLMSLDLKQGKIQPDKNHVHFDRANSHNNQIYSLFFDNSGQLFVGYYMLGASYSLPITNLFGVFSMGELNTKGMSVRNVSGDDDYLLIGTREGAYVLERNTGAVRHLGKEDLHSNLVLSSAKQGTKFYIGTYGGGLSVYDTATGLVSGVCFPGRAPESVFSVSADSQKEVWLGTDAGLFVLHGDSVERSITALPDGSPTGNVYEQYQDTRGRLWMSASNGGLRAYRQDSFQPLPEFSDSTLDVRQIVETRDNNLVFITYTGDVLTYRPDLAVSPHQEILSNVKGARGVVQDLNGYLWITSANNLFRYMPKEKSLTIYDKTDGIENPNFNPGKPIASSNGWLYLCNTDGLISANMRLATDSRISRSRAVPSHIEDSNGMRLFRGKTDEDGKFSVSLPNKERHIKIFFSDFTYSGMSSGRYQYSLDGGKNWQPVGSDMSVNIVGMRSGRNTLLVRQLGNPSTQTVVEIDVPADGAWISWLIAVLCLAVAIYAFILLRKRHKAHVATVAAAPAPAIAKPAAEIPEISAPTLASEDATTDDALVAEFEKSESDSEQKEEEQKKKYAANYMSEKECNQMVKRMNDLLRETRMYTNPDLKIADIAHALGISSHKVSYVLSQHLNTNYYDYIYAFRIEEFKRLVKEDKKQMFTLTALSEQAGFNSRATFFRAFKKAEGITPGDYMKKQRGGE